MSLRLRIFLGLSVITMIVSTAPAPAALTEVWTTFVGQQGLFRAMTVGKDGTAYWAGLIGLSNRETLQAFDSDGDRLWKVNLKKKLVPTVLAAMPDGSGVLVGGFNDKSRNPAPFLALHQAKNGQQVWSVNPGQFFRALLVTADAIYLTGAGAGNDVDLWLTKLSLQGKVIWQRSVDTGVYDDGQALAEDPKTGRIVVAGKAARIDFDSGLEETSDVLVAAFSPDGDLVWSKTAKARKGKLQDVVSVAISRNGQWVYVAGGFYQDGPDGATLTTLFFQRFKGTTGAATKAKLYDPTGDGNQFPVGMVTKNGQTFHLVASGRLGEFPTPFSGIILTTNNRGKLRDTTSFVIDETDTAVYGVGMDGQGALLTAGDNRPLLFLRKDLP